MNRCTLEVVLPDPGGVLMSDDVADPVVRGCFERSPSALRDELLHLRALVFEVAAEAEGIGEVVETLKWGQPSYVARGGSPIRLGWVKGSDDLCCLFFHCQTRLVDTFREIYADQLEFDGNRAIVLRADDRGSTIAVKHCIRLALTYHRVKHLPMLGA